MWLVYFYPNYVHTYLAGTEMEGVRVLALNRVRSKEPKKKTNKYFDAFKTHRNSSIVPRRSLPIRNETGGNRTGTVPAHVSRRSAVFIDPGVVEVGVVQLSQSAV